MDERTELLVCLGAAAAANCVPCFEYYFGKATALGLAMDEILKAVELANKVKGGSHLMTKNGIGKIMGADSGAGDPGCGAAKHPCCG